MHLCLLRDTYKLFSIQNMCRPNITSYNNLDILYVLSEVGLLTAFAIAIYYQYCYLLSILLFTINIAIYYLSILFLKIYIAIYILLFTNYIYIYLLYLFNYISIYFLSLYLFTIFIYLFHYISLCIPDVKLAEVLHIIV